MSRPRTVQGATTDVTAVMLAISWGQHTIFCASLPRESGDSLSMGRANNHFLATYASRCQPALVVEERRLPTWKMQIPDDTAILHDRNLCRIDRGKSRPMIRIYQANLIVQELRYSFKEAPAMRLNGVAGGNGGFASTSLTSVR